jgi:hypothetical protein
MLAIVEATSQACGYRIHLPVNLSTPHLMSSAFSQLRRGCIHIHALGPKLPQSYTNLLPPYIFRSSYFPSFCRDVSRIWLGLVVQRSLKTGSPISDPKIPRNQASSDLLWYKYKSRVSSFYPKSIRGTLCFEWGAKSSIA